MTITTGDLQGIPTVKLDGRLDFAAVQEIHEPFLQATAARQSPVIVDLTNVEWMASIAIRLFLEASKAMTQLGHRMVLFNAQERVDKSLRSAGLHICMDLSNDANEAVKLARTPGTRFAGGQ